ncbi:MAG: double-strand break repair helicase AddA [Hyphomicrobiales bacterium]
MSNSLTIDDNVRMRQATASNPALSAWVGANAGSGKTYVLSRRVIRLLLEGAEPSKILCLTFTKAAAAEMSERVFKALAEWTTAADSDLYNEIVELTGKAPRDEQMREARRLFAKALETPGGLKIQTIHAFCERLLHQFPVEANVAGHFEVLDDVGKEKLLHEAERDVLMEAAHNPNGVIATNLSIAIAHASDMGYEKALRNFLSKQQTLLDWIEELGGVVGAVEGLRDYFNLGANDTIAGFQEQMMELPNFPPVYMESLRQELAASSVKFQAQADLIAIILSTAPIAERQNAMFDFFFTKKGEAKKLGSVASKDIIGNFSDLEERLTQEQERLLDLLDKQKAIHTIEATQALLTLGSAVAKSYTGRKSASGMMDFDDLIHKSADLLEKPDAAAWVHYKLDQGLDHILVDEAQDTSPRQWDVIKHLADEFFSGEGARTQNRTLFAVGDEKQSIYSFQGASPEKFGEMRKHFLTKAQNAEKRFEKIALSLSFRSTADVLGAVDIVCGNDAIKGYLTEEYEDHTAARQNQPGFVEFWAPFAKPTKAVHKGAWWQPMDQLGEQSEQVRLAEKVAKTIKNMLDKSERLEGTGTLITAGDILILTRKRGAQVDAINRALKAHGIAVAGSDRLKLMDNIAILDLLALADFVLLSEDDLALAGLLKSPLISLTEDDLFALAHNRTGTLWKELYLRGREGDSRFVSAYEKLDAWRSEADFVPPYDFFLNVLSRDHGREAFLQGLGRETDELLEAFLTQVQTYEQTEVPSLQGFVSWFRNGAVEIKRDMESARDEARVMTVHGSKGLEAPIVFLIDGSAPVHASHQPDILGLGQEGNEPYIWKRSSEHKTTAQNDAIEREKSEAMAEYYRLLYVAMTRARDRLYLFSTASEKGDPPKQGWYEITHKALSEHEYTTPIVDEAGETIAWRWASSKAAPLSAQESESILEAPVHKPDWLATSVVPHVPVAQSIAPSRTGGHDEIEGTTDTTGEAFLGVDPIKRGLLMHRLLERLPSITPSQREATALRYLSSNLSDIDDAVHGAITEEVLRVLESPLTGSLFAVPNARSEVPVYGTITINGATYKVRGEIDRLIIVDDTVHIVDFKTNRSVPDHPTNAPKVYRRQLALYRALLMPMFPDKHIKASLLWTNGPVLMPLAESDLIQALKTI